MKNSGFLFFLSAVGALGADPASQVPAAQQPEPAAVRSVTPAEWLKAQPKPLFRPGGTLPRLTRYGWVLPTDARIELAENWGYALEFGGYVGEAEAARVDDPKSDEAKLAALAKADPKRYPLAVICTRKLPGTEAPPETWTRDKDGKVLNGKAQSMDGTEWSEGKGAVFSPEAPDAVWKLAGEYRAGPLRELQKRGVPISIVLNGGEYGLGVLGFAQPVWSQDPRIVAAVKQTTNGSWQDYASVRKGRAERLIADEVRTAVPQRQLYIYYTAGGRTLRNKDWAIDDWGPKWQHMRGVSDLPSNEVYYRHFNDGFTGRLNLLTIALNAVAAEIATGDPLSYNWTCAGWPRGDVKKYIADLDRWTGFLKCYYTAGMIGGNVGYYDYPKGGFAEKFPADAPPAWLRQMVASAHVHALFSQVEDMVRESDLLPGPMRHAISSADPAYEFPTGDETTRVLGRKHRSKAEWLLTAWASDGPDRAATIRVPELGRLTLRARACGSVYRAVLKNGEVSLTQLDEEGSTFTRTPAGQPVTAPADLAVDSVPASRNLFAQKYGGQRTDFSGQVGFEFVPAAPLSVTALGRSVSGVALQRAHPVTLWDPATEKPLARVSVSPASKVDEQGFAFERLATPVSLEMGRSYRLTSGEEQGGDPMMDIGDIRAHLAVADVGPGVFAVGDAYPKQKFGREGQGYGLPTFHFDTTGLASELLKVGPRAPAPFLRELTTGYLLNCSFMSPRPYCWQGADCRLSGWEVDRSGGNMAFQPTCLYPDGFAFHSDWFKLVDTSSNAAVTLNHQIARQTNGQLTLEFRFKLPARMDGARWQLRDLEQAGVSLITVDDNLCVESSEGKPVVLARIENGREYGVKVVADITTKTADVFVDGELKAQAASFAHPVSTIDFFLVKTGDAATGEMFINPVNIFKGYAVNETFVTCGAGKLPAGWTMDHVGHTVSVEEFECGTKPDIFSLKLAATAERRAATWRSFPPTQGKTVFEYRFLLPEKRDGAAAEIYGGKNGVRIATLGEDLCVFDEKTQSVPLVRHYRTNLWYMVKVIADPGAGTADVFVNGKSVARQVKFLSGLKAFNAVRFDSERGAVMWVDDVQVYPWRDYPADYVPEPKPVAVKNGVLLGAQSCNLWREGTAYAGWDYVYPYRDKRKPYLGWYDEGHPEETDWEIKWQVEHGIGFEQHCWYRPNNAINHPIKDGVLDQGLIKGLFNARYSHLKKFTIMCTDEGACETNPSDWRENIIPYWIEYFFKDPRYLTLDGKPVLSIYHLGHLQRMFGGADGARQAIQTLRDEVAKAGLPGIIVLMEDRTANPATLKAMKAIGVDACYAYTWGTPDSEVQRKQNAAQRDAAAAVGFLSLPSISMGWDREAWGVKEGGWLPVADYQALAQWTRDEFMPTLPADSLGRRIVMLANWNEFGEGHFLMPSTLAGFGYVDALREVFTEGSAHEDLAPTDAQKRRFTVLYPRE